MADLKDLKKIAEDILPVLKQLFELVRTNADIPDKSDENGIINRLKKLIAESNQPTKASLVDRADVITAMRTALTEILIRYASTNQELPETTVRIIQTQRNALRDAFGLLLERSTFEDIPQLLPRELCDEISIKLRNADSEIAQRQKAKKILDVIVEVAIIAAQIAAKLA